MLKASNLLFLATCTLFIFACTTTKVAPTTTSLSSEPVPSPTRFAKEIAVIKMHSFDKEKDRIVFTGSSSIRFWPKIQDYYPAHQVLNTGFGGSQMSDLHYYLEETVLRFAPSKVFIYEGDNDIAAGQSLNKIMDNTKVVVQKIHQKYPTCKIILIAAKPSLARWNFKEKYEALNASFEKYAKQTKNVQFADVWSIMLNEEGLVFPNIFIADGLHMNKEGYDLWDQVIHPFVEQEKN